MLTNTLVTLDCTCIYVKCTFVSVLQTRYRQKVREREREREWVKKLVFALLHCSLATIFSCLTVCVRGLLAWKCTKRMLSELYPVRTFDSVQRWGKKRERYRGSISYRRATNGYIYILTHWYYVHILKYMLYATISVWRRRYEQISTKISHANTHTHTVL